ncbi:MAG: prepilin-type N-terminal cleavage/methylation domain-containing protein [Bdellovibrionales bacterium]
MRNSKGFTLIETLIAMMLLATALITLSSTWSGSLNAVNKSKNMNIVAMLLKSKMADVELELKDKKFVEMKTEDSGDFEDFPDYSWKMKMEQFQSPDFAALLLSEGGQDELVLRMMSKMRELFEKNIKEVQVTIIWNTGEKTFEYSATTTIVDYSQPLDLMGGI